MVYTNGFFVCDAVRAEKNGRYSFLGILDTFELDVIPTRLAPAKRTAQIVVLLRVDDLTQLPCSGRLRVTLQRGVLFQDDFEMDAHGGSLHFLEIPEFPQLGAYWFGLEVNLPDGTFMEICSTILHVTSGVAS